MERSISVKKTKLILMSLILALTLMFSAGYSTRVYADDGDPQGTSGAPKTQPAPQQPAGTPDSVMVTVVRVIGLFFWF